MGGKMLCTLHWDAQSLEQEGDRESLQGTVCVQFFNLYLQERGEGSAAAVRVVRCLLQNTAENHLKALSWLPPQKAIKL